MIAKPSGEPNDRNAVFEGTLVLQMYPLKFKFSILYAPLKSAIVLLNIWKYILLCSWHEQLCAKNALETLT